MAFVMGDRTRHWWPEDDPQPHGVSWVPNHWPQSLPRSADLLAFEMSLLALGFAQCPPDAPGRVAVFARDGKARHVALEVACGVWASKLGPPYLIAHPLEDLRGGRYGEPTLLMNRPTGAVC